MLWTPPAACKAIFKNVASMYSDSSQFFNFPYHKRKTSIATKSPWEQGCGRTAVSAQGQSLLLVSPAQLASC